MKPPRQRNTKGKIKLIVRRVRKRGGGYIYPKPPKKFLVIWVNPDRPPPAQTPLPPPQG